MQPGVTTTAFATVCLACFVVGIISTPAPSVDQYALQLPEKLPGGFEDDRARRTYRQSLPIFSETGGQAPTIEMPNRARILTGTELYSSQSFSDNEIPDVNLVPELQVGCEGLEATQRRKRSDALPEEDRYLIENVDPRELNITPVTFEESVMGEQYSQEKYYEEMDELFRLKQPEKPMARETRGDIQVEPEEMMELWSEEADEPLRGDVSEAYAMSQVKDSTSRRAKRDVIDPSVGKSSGDSETEVAKERKPGRPKGRKRNRRYRKKDNKEKKIKGDKMAEPSQNQERWQEVDRQIWEAKLRDYLMKITPRYVGYGKQQRKNENRRQPYNTDPGRRPDHDKYHYSLGTPTNENRNGLAYNYEPPEGTIQNLSDPRRRPEQKPRWFSEQQHHRRNQRPFDLVEDYIRKNTPIDVRARPHNSNDYNRAGSSGRRPSNSTHSNGLPERTGQAARGPAPLDQDSRRRYGNRGRNSGHRPQKTRNRHGNRDRRPSMNEIERRRMQEERRRQQGNRYALTRKLEHEPRYLERLRRLPVSAHIVIDPQSERRTRRAALFPGLDPMHKGLELITFPVPQTKRPPIESPSSCVWAVISCCSSPNIRLKKCFDAHGCPGVDWDPNPCKDSITDAAKDAIDKFYSASEM